MKFLSIVGLFFGALAISTVARANTPDQMVNCNSGDFMIVVTGTSTPGQNDGSDPSVTLHAYMAAPDSNGQGVIDYFKSNGFKTDWTLGVNPEFGTNGSGLVNYETTDPTNEVTYSFQREGNGVRVTATRWSSTVAVNWLYQNCF